MSHLINLFAIVLFFQATFGCVLREHADVSKVEKPQVQIFKKDIKSIEELKALPGSVHPDGFIGDLEIGKRKETDEVIDVFAFIVNNYTGQLHTFNLLKVTFLRKIINYAIILNAENSYGAVCGNGNNLPSNESPDLWVRVAPNSNVTLTTLLYGHDLL